MTEEIIDASPSDVEPASAIPPETTPEAEPEPAKATVPAPVVFAAHFDGAPDVPLLVVTPDGQVYIHNDILNRIAEAVAERLGRGVEYEVQ